MLTHEERAFVLFIDSWRDFDESQESVGNNFLRLGLYAIRDNDKAAKLLLKGVLKTFFGKNKLLNVLALSKCSEIGTLLPLIA